jgi:heme oxygenase
MADDLRMLARLNAETQPHHGDADGDVDVYLFRRDVTAEAYRTFLCRVYGFLVPIEAALLSAPSLEEAIDVRARVKSALLVHDLLSLGMSMDQVNALPQAAGPTFRGPAAALGWLYVIERPMLSAAVIRSHLATSLPTEMVLASAYLACYSGQVGTLWRELGQAMDRVAYSQAVADRMVVSAHESFRALSRWRRHEPKHETGIRIAG